MTRTRIPFHLSLCAVAVLISACGGGDATAPGGGAAASSGFVVDGYLNGATVVCDTNGNGIADSGERTVISDSSGFFRFAPSCESALIASGGTSIDTGLPFTGTLKAPVGATVITPLTTLMASGMSQAKVNEVMGLPSGTNLLTTDPASTLAGSSVLANADLMKKTLVVQQLAQKITEVVAGLATSGGDAARAAIYSEVMAALAQALAANPALVTGGTISETVTQALVKAAAQRVAGSTTLPAGVKAGIAALNADSLAQVMAAALKAQGEAILGAAGDALTATTKTAQESTAITTFVQTNKANSALTGAPTAATADLSQTLKNNVSGTTPPPANGNTDLLNFDTLLPVTANGGEGGEGSGLVAAPAGGGSGQAYRVLRSGGQAWALAVLEKTVPFTADRKTITAQVYSPMAGIPIAMKVEAGTVGVEVQANEAVVQGWQTLSWTFTGVNPSLTFNKIVLLPRLGTVDQPPGQSYYFDNIQLKAAVVAPPAPTGDTDLLNFDSLLPVTALGGEGGEGSGLVAAPAGGGSGQVYRVLRSGGQPYALAILEKTIPFTSDRKTISAQVFSPAAGIPMVMKMEGPAGANTGDVQANEAVVAGWQTLTWTFTSADPTKTYNKIVLLPRLGTVDQPPGQSYYFDNIKLKAAAGSSGGSGGSGEGTVMFNFDTLLPVTAIGGEGGEGSGLVAAPAGGGSGQVYRVLRSGGQPYALAILEKTIPFTSDRKTISAKVYSPIAGIPMVMKMEGPAGANTGDKQANETVVQGWQTLTWTFSNVDTAKTYNKMVLLPRLGTIDQPPGQSYYFDDITLIGGSGAGTGGGSGSGSGSTPGGNPDAAMGSGGPQTMAIATANDPHGLYVTGNGVFAGDYIGTLDANNNHAGWLNAATRGTAGNGNASNGNIGYYQDSALSNSSQKVEENGWVTGNIDNAGGVPGFFRYFILRGPASSFNNSFMGLYVNARNNGTVDVSSYGNIKFKLWGPAEMYQNQNLNPQLEVILAGPKVPGCVATGSGGTEIKKTFTANQKVGAGSSYTMSLAGWTVNGVCGTDTNATAANTVLTKLSRVVFNLPGTSFNFTNATGDPTLYATGINLGPIVFTP